MKLCTGNTSHRCLTQVISDAGSATTNLLQAHRQGCKPTDKAPAFLVTALRATRSSQVQLPFPGTHLSMGEVRSPICSRIT